jgi:hypothetical protein
MVTNITLERMEGQIKWYSEKSAWNQEWFKHNKILLKPYGYVDPAPELLRITIFVKIKGAPGIYLKIANL